MNTSYLTPKEILDDIQARLERKSVCLVGVVVKDERGYMKLSDGENAIDLVFDKEEHPLGAKILVEGFITYYLHRPGGGIYPRLNVKNWQVLEDGTQVNQRKELLERLRNSKRGRVFVYELPELADRLRIVVLHGRSAQTQRDFITGFSQSAGKFENRVKFSFVETSLSDEELTQKIKDLSTEEFHALFLVRGGGTQEELSRVGGFNSSLAILELGKPFYTAIGHSLDKNLSLLELIADQTFDTPSLAGTALGKAVKAYAEREILEQKLKELRVEVQSLEQLKETNNSLKQELEKARVEVQSLEQLKETNNSLRLELNKVRSYLTISFALNALLLAGLLVLLFMKM